MTDYTILLELAIILLSTKILGIISKKLGLPQVVGFLLAGLIIGPCLLNWVKPTETLKIIAEIGVIMIMFSAGLETGLDDIKKNGKAAFVVAALGVIVPLVFGFLISVLFHGGFKNMDTHKLLTNIFVGVILTATSVSITVETLREMGKLKSKAGTTILSAAIIDDIIGIIILSILIGLKNPAVKPVMAIVNTILFFICAIIGGIVIHAIFKFLANRYPKHRRVPILALVVCLLYSYCAEHFFGVADITGAYMAGVVFSGIRAKNNDISHYIETKIDVSAYMIFTPVFFASIGIKASFEGFNVSILLFAICFVAVGIITKVIGCGLGARMVKMSKRDSLIVGIGMMARGEVALIVMTKGIQAGFLDNQYLATGVLLVIITSLFAPIALRFLYRNHKGTDLEILPELQQIEETHAIPKQETVIN